MNRIPLFVILSALVCGLTAQTIVFENVNVVPMDRERVLEKQTVVVRDGKIAQIGAVASIRAPEGAARVDGTGKYLIPGLTEMHGHLPGAGASRELVEHILYLYVANGVTTVRGMLGNAASLEHRADVGAGRLLGPRFYVAGPGFTGASAPSPEAAVKMVREQKAAGYDLLKILEGLSPASYQALAKTAHEVRIDFAGHVPAEVGVRGAIEAGQRSIDHLDNYLEGLEAADSPVRNADPRIRAMELPFHIDERKIAELARLTREKGVWNVPTMALWENFHNSESGDALRAALTETRFMPRSTVEQWVRQKNNLLQSNNVFMGFGVGGKTGTRVIELRKKVLQALHYAGAKIALGTDSPQTFSVPGFSIHREMKAMVGLGFTPYEVLVCGTRNVAEYFGASQETGTIAQGKRADLILLDANPLADISNVARRAGVVVAGRWLPRQEIEERLEKLAAAAARM